MRRFLIPSVSMAVLACCAALLLVAGVLAVGSSITFESYALGNINGQDGWSKTGPYDVAVVDPASYSAAAGYGFDSRALRVSNAVTSGSFGDHTIAPALTTPASESGNTYFEASFELGAALSTQQTGLKVSVSPDGGGGSRMSYLRFEDQADGIHVYFDDVTDPGPLGTVADFNETDIATVSRTAAHSFKFAIWLVPGAGNDVVRIYVDGTLKITGTTWEDYYRYDPEQAGNGNVVPGIATLIIPTRGTAAPGNSGNGYLIDNVSFSSATVSQCTTTCYVDAVNGNNAFSGSSADDAKATIQAAIDTVAAGGQIRVLPGTYNETAPNSSPSVFGGTYTFGLFFAADKPGISLIGVDADDTPITDPTATLATINTIGDANFGPDGIFVEAANTTIQGVTIGGNTPWDNKTIEVLADNFTLQYSATDVPNGGGSVYFNDPSADGSVIKSYHILNNAFLDGTSVDLTSGAGLTGPVSGREIKDNTFDLQDNGYNAISFNGSDTGVPWFTNSVGGAVITGNSFSSSTQYIRARGTYDNSQFDWASYFNSNTFDRAVIFGANPPVSVGEWSYTSGPYTFNHVRRIGSVIQTEIDHASPGDTVLVKDGTYAESPNINKSLTLKSSGGRDATTIQLQAGPTYLGALTIGGDDVTVDGFTISGRDGTNAVIAASNVLLAAGLNDIELINNRFLVGAINNTSSNGDDGFGVLTTYNENAADDVASLTVKDNLFAPLSTSGGRAFYVNPGVDVFTFQGNTITGNFTRTAIAQAKNGLVKDNIVTGSGASAGLGAWGYPDPDVYGKTTFTGNTISNVTSAITIYEANGVTVDHNVISSVTNSVRVLDLESFSGQLDPTTVKVNRNSLAGNGIIAAAGFSADVDGSCNWWGSATGPGAIASGSGALVTSNVAYIPWLISSDLTGGCAAITVNSAADDANGDEATTLETSGSFTGDIASITSDAAFGTFTDNLDGTWSWSYLAPDNYDAATITVTGHGTNGTTAEDVFSTAAENVDPTATFNAPADALYSTGFDISLSDATDDSAIDLAEGFTFAFDCGLGYGSTTATDSAACTAPADPGSITVKGKVFDKDGGVTEYTASVEITQPEISLTPASRDFGPQLVNTSSAPFTFTVENTGTADLTISGVSLAGVNPGHFGIDTNNCDGAVLAPSETCLVDVFFEPGSLGTKNARLEVDSNDPDMPTASASLTGSGAAASNGVITINLDAHPNGSQSFTFHGTGGIGVFNLVDDGTSANTAQFSEPAGSYTFSVDGITGWTLTDLTCDAPEAISILARMVVVDLAAGENVTCTFTESLPQPDGLIAGATGPFSGDDTYSATVLPSQTVTQSYAGTETKSFWVKIQNDGLKASRFNLNADLTGWRKFKVHFYSNGTDITSQVLAGTYNFRLNGGAQRIFEIRVRAATTAGPGKTRDIDLVVRSTSFSAVRDVIRAHAVHI